MNFIETVKKLKRPRQGAVELRLPILYHSLKLNVYTELHKEFPDYLPDLHSYNFTKLLNYKQSLHIYFLRNKPVMLLTFDNTAFTLSHCTWLGYTQALSTRRYLESQLAHHLNITELFILPSKLPTTPKAIHLALCSVNA